jgi:transcription elongation factor GreA
MLTMAQTVWLTEAGKSRLEEELNDLRTRRRPELHVRIQEATESGDISDNSEYEELKDEWASLEARIHELEQTLERAEIISRDAGSDLIGLGSKVTLRSDDGEEETWVLVSPQEANTLDGTISTESPVGQSLVGRRAGDSATVRTPSGAIVYTVVSVA